MASAIMDNAYNYFLTTYGTSTVSRYDAHKRSELRNTYNKIVKANKESPLYKIKDSRDLDKFAIDIKENARNIKNVIASLSADGEGIESAFRKKVAVSDQPDIVSVEYIGNNSGNDNTPSFSVEVKQLAAPQMNLGNYLSDSSLDILPGSYSFDLDTTTASYEFRFAVNADDTNCDVLEKLSRLFKTANIDLNAEIISDGQGHSALKIESKQTGLRENEDYLFRISPDGANLSKAAIDTLGIDHVAAEAHNSSFLLNGKERSSYSNTFTINNTFELTLKSTTAEGDSATIGYKTNVDAVADNIQSLVDSYNQMISVAGRYSVSQPDSSKLISDIGGTARRHKSEFDSLGLMVHDNGTISVDRALLTDAVGDAHPEESFSILNHFRDSLLAKADKVSIDPMNYVNKIMVAYKNPGHNFATPYITSIYSGMMLDSYC